MPKAQAEMLALLNLGAIRRASGKFAPAERALLRAESLGLELGSSDELFEIYYELHEVARQPDGDDAKRLRYFKKCERYYPLVSGRTLKVVAFERMLERCE